MRRDLLKRGKTKNNPEVICNVLISGYKSIFGTKNKEKKVDNKIFNQIDENTITGVEVTKMVIN